jgi:hypothetical protein
MVDMKYRSRLWARAFDNRRDQNDGQRGMHTHTFLWGRDGLGKRGFVVLWRALFVVQYVRASLISWCNARNWMGWTKRGVGLGFWGEQVDGLEPRMVHINGGCATTRRWPLTSCTVRRICCIHVCLVWDTKAAVPSLSTGLFQLCLLCFLQSLKVNENTVCRFLWLDCLAPSTRLPFYCCNLKLWLKGSVCLWTSWKEVLMRTKFCASCCVSLSSE